MNNITETNKERGNKMETTDKKEIFGYKIEFISYEPNKVAYRLHGPKVTYTLMRNSKGDVLYALNSKMNVCGIKGNYHFTDINGYLTTCPVI
jgi:hypothetical protein